MKIQINSKEIEEAVICYLEKQGINTQTQVVTVDVVSGRGDVGPRVDIHLEPKTTNEEPINREAEDSSLPFGS
jgi:hypothetical protein